MAEAYDPKSDKILGGQPGTGEQGNQRAQVGPSVGWSGISAEAQLKMAWRQDRGRAGDLRQPGGWTKGQSRSGNSEGTALEAEQGGDQTDRAAHEDGPEAEQTMESQWNPGTSDTCSSTGAGTGDCCSSGTGDCCSSETEGF